MLQGLFILTLILSTTQGSAASARREGTATLSGVVAAGGHPVEGANLVLTADSVTETGVSGEDGSFRFEAPPGSYQLEVLASGYYPMVVKDLKLVADLPPLPVFLVRRPGAEETRDHPKPELGIEFVLDPPGAPNQVMTGTLLLTNLGRGPIPVPTEPWHREESVLPEMFLRMQVSVRSGTYPAWFGREYGCLAPVRCRLLAPSESLSLPVKFHRAPGGELPQTYARPGEYLFEAGVIFEPAGLGSKRTEAVTETFELSIPRLP